MSEDAYDSVGAVAVPPGTQSCRRYRSHPWWDIDTHGARIVFPTTLHHPFDEWAG
jgi:hypothetical protein